MADQGGSGPQERGRRSRLDDYVEMAEPVAADGETPLGGTASPTSAPAPEPPEQPSMATAPAPAAPEDIARARREFGALLGEFRRTPVLVPLDTDEAPLVGDYGGIRWI
ncbi:hypothetical protein [Streptomyces griseus]|uniref:hypothetical protein n=1 Tax=Streptomyces griseus TaxID=1911 RepID=UPI00373AE3C0